MSSSCENFPGTVYLVAQISASAGEGDKAAKLLSAVKKNAEEKEPDCVEYRIVRQEDTFAILEQYKSSKAFEFHTESEAFQAFRKVVQESGWKLSLTFFPEEVSV